MTNTPTTDSAVSPVRELPVIKMQRQRGGGLHVWSDDVPSLILAGQNEAEVVNSIFPALDALLGKTKIVWTEVDYDAIRATLSRPQDTTSEVVARLLTGVVDVGMHDDNSTELFDVDGANDTMADAAALISSLIAERDGLAKDLAAQIAGHQLTASQSTGNLMRANTATSKLDEVETRVRKHWQAYRDLRLDIIGHGPMCRDCADENGRCPHSGQPCDPDEAVKEQIAKWRTAETQLAALTKRVGELEGALTPSADTKADYIGEFQFTVTMMELDESDEPYECQRMVTVPWTTIKEIMGAISGRAARRLTGGEG